MENPKLLLSQSGLILKNVPMTKEDIELVKQIGGRKTPKDGVFVFPPFALYADDIRRHYPDVEIASNAKHFWEFPTGFRVPSILLKVPKKYHMMLDYQKEAVRYLIGSPHRGNYLGLSPGLGKTAVSVITAEILQATRTLVIAPKPILYTWKRELYKWSEMFWGEVISTGDEIPNSGWVITNYEHVARYPNKFKKQWDLVILDEAIFVKNRKAKRTKTILECFRNSNRVWALSGLPVSKTFADLYSQFRILNPRAFPSYWRFVESFCILEDTPWGINIVGSRRDVDPKYSFRDIMFIRHMDEVLDIPGYVVEYVDLEMLPKQKKVYRQVLEDFLMTLESGTVMPVPNRIAQIIRLLQIVSNPYNIDPLQDYSVKADAIVQMIKEELIEFPLLIWTHWKPSADALSGRLSRGGIGHNILHGDTDKKAADTLLTAFTGGFVPILVMSLGVGKYGHTITNAKTVIYMDRLFDMDAFIQSQHRVRRIGLEHSVRMIIMRCPDTIDDYVEDNLSGKAKSVAQMTNADLIELLKSITPQETK